MGGSGKQKTYTIRQDELDALIDRAVNAGIEAFRKEEQKATDRQLNRNLHNTRKLLESYRALKNDLSHSEYESEEAQEELRFKCIEDLMGDVWAEHSASEEIVRKEIRRLQENAWRKRQIDRAMELLEEDCSRPGNPEAMRKYRVLKAMYIDDEKMTVAELAEQESVTERMIHYDAREGLKMLTPYIFSIDAIITRP